MKTKLKSYQKEGVALIEHFAGRILLADEMQLGKTIQALKWIKNHPEKRPVIVICPSISKWVWEEQAITHTNLRSNVLEGATPPKFEKSFLPAPILIINFEILEHWIPYLKKLKPQVIIIDECHYIKSRTALRTKAVIALSKKVRHVIAISGTPLVNRPIELYNILHLLWPDVFDSFFKYAFRYCQPVKTPWGWQYKGAKNIKELHRRLKGLGMIRRLKKNVMKELPEKERLIIPLDIEKRNEYEEALHDFIAWLSKQGKIKKAERASRAEKLVQMSYLKRLSAESKMCNVFKWIDSFLKDNDEKLVLFAVHRKIINMLHDRYKNISVVVDGSVKNRDRKKIEKYFKRNKKIRIFIGNIKAAGISISLSSAASSLAFVEINWTPGEHTQAEDRIHGIGQTKAVTIYYLIAKNTIEEKLCKLIQKKQQILSATLDGGKQINKLDIYSKLESILKKEGRRR